MAATVRIDGTPYAVDPGRNLLDVCLSLGMNLPYFCWHPSLGSVGACRQCAVKQYADENDTQGRLVMACMTPAADGTRIALNEPEASDFRARVIEWLMMNHPHDCPVCEEGGECHLQDMTVMTGHTYRRYRGSKRTFRNQDLGPFINHEMNRCIACYRCVRFYRDYAGGTDLQAFATHHHVFFGRREDGVLENAFSGNLVEVCPTGVFTDKPFSRRYVRKWDLQTAPSICVHCGLGCNTTPGERYGVLRRIQNRYNGEVNGHFLCDRGRFGYDFVNGECRLSAPEARSARPDELRGVSKRAALEQIAGAGRPDGGLIGIGSARASLEANFALQRLVGAGNFYMGVSANEAGLLRTTIDILTRGSVRAPPLAETERADAVLVLGEDVTNTAPRLALALRQAVRRRQLDIADAEQIPRWHAAAVGDAAGRRMSPLFVAGVTPTKLDDVATATHQDTPDGIARLGFAVAAALDAAAPDVAGLSSDTRALAERIAAALEGARRPLVVAGAGLGSEAILEAAASVAGALGNDGGPGELFLTLPECNSLGAGLLGGAPLDDAFARARRGEAGAAIVLERDLFRHAAPADVARFGDDVPQLVVVDHQRHATAAQADVLLPAATFAEGDGTLVSSEGRAQRFFAVHPPDGDVQESWRWMRDVARRTGAGDALDWAGLDDVTAACADAIPALRGIEHAAPGAGFRRDGRQVHRATPRASGRTAARAHVDLHEPAPPPDPDSPLAFSMEGYHSPRLPGGLIPYFWSPGWNSIQSVHKFQDETGALRGGDPGVRLIEPRPEPAARAYAPAIPPPPSGADGFELVRLHEIFGSDELSMQAPAVAERAPAPYVALHPEDAAALGCGAGDAVELDVAGRALELPVRIVPGLARGVAGVPAGLAGLAGLAGVPAVEAAGTRAHLARRGST